MKKFNKLFILMTDSCNLGCKFCNYRDRRENSCNEELSKLKKIDISKGYAKESLKNLMQDSFVIGLSGGGEPLVNFEGIQDLMNNTTSKRFVITTNGSFHKKTLEGYLEDINNIGIKTGNKAIIRLSIDKYHDEAKGHIDNLGNILEWHFKKRWTNCGGLFFRTNILDEKHVKARFEEVCKQNNWELEWDNSEDNFAKGIKINGEEFRLLLRPIIGIKNIGIEDKFNIHEYTDLLSEVDGTQIKIGLPKGCHGCQGCKGYGEIACQIINGLDVTIDTNGEVYLYGGELESLGSIYEESLDFELIEKRINENKYLSILQNKNLKDVINHLCKDGEFKDIIEDTNYPYAIIKELKKINQEKLKRMILELK